MTPEERARVSREPAQGRERWVINKVRALMSWYSKGLDGGSHLRIAVNAADVDRRAARHPARVLLRGPRSPDRVHMAVRPDGLTPAPDQPPVWARPRAAWTLTVLASMLAVAIFGVHAWHRHHAGAAGLLAYRGIDPTTPGPDGFVIMNLRHGTPAAEAGLRRGDRVHRRGRHSRERRQQDGGADRADPTG